MQTLSSLLSSHCQPLKGAQHLLSEQRIADFLALLPSDWDVIDEGKAIAKTFRFNNYYETMAFVNALAFIAHQEDHHPDLSVHYNKAIVRFSTHDVGGLSENDFICAAKCQRLQRSED